LFFNTYRSVGDFNNISRYNKDDYLRNSLGYETDLQYWMFDPVNSWDRDRNNTTENLRSAMAENSYLNVLVQSGYYDGGTPYFDTNYTIWNMDPSGKLQDRISFKGYRSGHMMYLRKEDLKTSDSLFVNLFPNKALLASIKYKIKTQDY